MDAFTLKLRAIYTKLFQENIDDFTKALIDYTKFDRTRFDVESEAESKRQFFLNRKTVLRRWLNKGSNCTNDFQKSYNNYKLSHYQLKGEALFSLNDFKNNSNLTCFDEQIDNFLLYQKRVQRKIPYCYVYLFSETEKKIQHYKIVEWTKGESNQTLLTFQQEDRRYQGTISVSDENNIFITLKKDNNILYMLFHDSNDSSTKYIVGVSMGFSSKDNKVPRSKKIIFSKELLDSKKLELKFILNETEVISTIENRLNLNIPEDQVHHFNKYANKFKKYNEFFKRLRQSTYKQNFYYRLAFKEFSAINKLFKKVAKEESYYILDYQRALLELLKTVEEINDISLQVVMQFNESNIFRKSSLKDLEIKSKFFNLYNNHNIQTTIIFVIKKDSKLDIHTKYLFSEMSEQHIDVKIIEEESIIHEVNSLDFIFIHLGDKRDFVLVDPIRDSKDVYKLFTSELTMDEYHIDYQKILIKSRSYSPEK